MEATTHPARAFVIAFLLTALASPILVMYVLPLGGLGAAISGALVTWRNTPRARAALTASAGIVAGCVPYLLAAAVVMLY